MTKEERDALSLPQYKEALERMVSCFFILFSVFFLCFIYLKAPEYEKIDLKERHKFVRPLKSASVKFAEVKRLGYNISRSLWNNCFNAGPRLLGNIQF